LPFNASAYQDPLSRPDQFECYAAVPISPVGVLGSSDWLCAAPNTASPTGRPGSFSLRLDQGNLASLSWTAPGGQQSFVLAEVPLDGSPSRTLVLPATTLKQARELLRQVTPRAIVLDVVLRGEDAWGFLAEVKASDATRNVPVVVATTVEDQHKGFGLGADAYVVKPVDPTWLLTVLEGLTRATRGQPILIVDDDETSRYVLRQLLGGSRYEILEATGGADGLRQAREARPAAIFLDLMMPGMSGFDVLDALRADERTRAIPVVILTSKKLEPADHRQLDGKVTAVLSKSTSSRELAFAALDFALSQTRS